MAKRTGCCDWCGAEFETVQPKTRFCSEGCRHVARARRRQDAKPRPFRACLFCGLSFVPPVGRRENLAYCSDLCRNRLHVRRGGERRKAQKATRYQLVRVAMIEQARVWATAHPEAVRQHGNQRRARLFGNLGYVPFTDSEWQRLVRRHGGRCAYCQVSGVKLDQDHVIPLARGGRHALANILPACRPCNASKGQKLLIEWLTQMRFRAAHSAGRYYMSPVLHERA